MRNLIKTFFFFALLILTAYSVKSQPGCPNIDAGPDQTLTCTTTCATLTATVFATGATTSYAVSQIPYNPPSPFNVGTSVLINIDDTWTQPISLPFDFCFFGNQYNKVLIGTNQILTFDLANAGGFCQWGMFTGTTLPTIMYQKNSIMGPYEDIDPTYLGNTYWQLIGTYPCRILVVSYYETPYFGDPNSVSTASCPNPLFATSQIVLYESTNVIEVYIKNKETCPGWNSGLATEGIQNATQTIGYAVPGRDGTVWTASNDAWRFTPNGTPNYTVSWWQGGTQISTNTSITVCPTTTTTYTAQAVYNCCSGIQVTVTDDVVVNVSNSMGLSINPANPTICGGGSSTLTASSTDPAATFQWNTSSTNASITVSPTSTTTYTVTASTPGCSSQASVDVTVSSNPVVSVNSPAICNGQSATLTASGATSYVWSTGNTNSSITISPTSTTPYTVTGTNSGCTGTGTGIVTVNPLPDAQISPTDASCGNNNGSSIATGGATYLWNNGLTSATITGLAPGNYTVTVTDPAGCSSSASAIINNTPVPTATASSTNETCGLSNGTATASAAGTCSPSYTYQWNTTPVQTSQTATNLPAGTYTVTVSCNGCTTTTSTVIANIAEPLSPATVSSTDEACGQANGTATVSTSGTCSPSFSYQWSTIPVQTTQAITNLPAGTYTVTVTCNGCTTSASTMIANIPVPTATASSTNETCGWANGTATASAVGTCSPSFSYQWSTIPMQTSQTATNLPAGTYTVTVTCNGCTTTTSTMLTNVAGPSVSISSITGATCSNANGSANALVTGGTPQYSYTWSCSPQQHTQNMVNVVAGNYVVTATDLNGCTATTSASISGTQSPTATTSEISEEICGRANGAVAVTANGGLGTYTYVWNNGDTASTVTGLTAGSYSVTVSDGSCTTSATVNVIGIPGPDADFSAHPNVLTIMDGPVSFVDNSSGTVTTWQWNFGDGTQNGSGKELNHDYENIGTYLVTLIVTDNNGCKDTTTDTIKVKDIFTFYVPNAFTPDGDGIDDSFYPKGINWDPNHFEMYIFDRWGNLIYQTRNVEGRWNGTVNNKGTQDDMLADVYVYLIRVKELEGPKHEYIGKVTLVR